MRPLCWILSFFYLVLLQICFLGIGSMAGPCSDHRELPIVTLPWKRDRAVGQEGETDKLTGHMNTKPATVVICRSPAASLHTLFGYHSAHHICVQCRSLMSAGSACPICPKPSQPRSCQGLKVALFWLLPRGGLELLFNSQLASLQPCFAHF